MFHANATIVDGDMRGNHRLIFQQGLIVLLLVSSPLAAGPVTAELKRDLHDAVSLAAAPLHWHRSQWARFGVGVAAMGALYAGDRHLYDGVQRNRTSATDRFARDVTPFGGHRALDLSLLMIAGGALSGQTSTRDAGRDALEAELWAAGVVTPALKHVFGRARPNQNEGAHSFHPLSAHHQSFPSGHATNAFAFATAVAGHYDNWLVPAIVYSIASGVAVSRVNDRAHFASDVLAGALIGRAVAKGVIARHTTTHMSWSVAPAVLHDRLAFIVRVSRP
ncbi:MAG: hypothetical protein NVSMB68_15370 [Thermoanaerobaculia bacterium]